MHSRFTAVAVLAAAVVLFGRPVGAQQSDIAAGPFVSYRPGSGRGPLGGLSLTIAGNPSVGLRASGGMAFHNTYQGSAGAASFVPPWGADADAVFAMSGAPFGARNRSAATFVFIGAGGSAVDSADVRLVTKNWSYGIGTMLPVGTIVDLFAESRWRMSRFVLPTAHPHPERLKELRFGMSLHLRATEAGPTRRR